MKYSVIFILLTVLILAGWFVWESVVARIVITYVAFNFLAFGIAYGRRSPRLWQKRRDGTLNPINYLLFAPLHFLNWFSLLLAVKLDKNKAFHEISPNVWLGRRLISHEADFFADKADMAVLDLTSEFAENWRLRTTKYLCIPVLDHTAPSKNQVEQGVSFIHDHAPTSAVFVHCALGHGRSAIVVVAWLLKHGEPQTLDAALNQLKTIRPGIGLEAGQLSVLKELFQKPE